MGDELPVAVGEASEAANGMLDAISFKLDEAIERQIMHAVLDGYRGPAFAWAIADGSGPTFHVRIHGAREMPAVAGDHTWVREILIDDPGIAGYTAMIAEIVGGVMGFLAPWSGAPCPHACTSHVCAIHASATICCKCYVHGAPVTDATEIATIGDRFCCNLGDRYGHIADQF